MITRCGNASQHPGSETRSMMRDLIIILLAHLIISVHRTASCSSISRSLYWFLSISTLAISTRVNLRRCVSVMSPSCARDSDLPGREKEGERVRVESGGAVAEEQAATRRDGDTHLLAPLVLGVLGGGEESLGPQPAAQNTEENMKVVV